MSYNRKTLHEITEMRHENPLDKEVWHLYNFGLLY